MSDAIDRLKTEQTSLIVQLHLVNAQKAALEQRLDRVAHTLAGYDMASKEAAAQPAETRTPAADATPE